MPSFPCDNTDDVFPYEIYEGILSIIPKEEKKLGRKLTDKEIDQMCDLFGVDPNPDLYSKNQNSKPSASKTNPMTGSTNED